MSITPTKKRYYLTLTKANVDRFSKLANEFGMPPGTMSKACDDVIRDLCGVFEEAKRKGTFGIEDLFRVMGTQMQLLMEEEKRDATLPKKRSTRTHK